MLLGGVAVWRHIGCGLLGGLGGGGVGQGAAGQDGSSGALAAGGREVGGGGWGGGHAGCHILGICRQAGGSGDDGAAGCLLARGPGTSQGGGPCGDHAEQGREGGGGGQLGQCSVDVHGGDAAAGDVGQGACCLQSREGRGRGEGAGEWQGTGDGGAAGW